MKRRSLGLAAVIAVATVLVASPAFAATIKTTVSTDRRSYQSGQVVKVTAVAKYSNGKAVRSTKSRSLKIYSSSGTRVVSGASMKKAGTGVYTYTYTVPSPARIGTWRIVTTVKDTSGVTSYASDTFYVRGKRSKPTPPPSVDPTVTPPPTTDPTVTPPPTTDPTVTTPPSTDPTVTPPTGTGPHAALAWKDYPTNCRGCHSKQSADMYQGLHYQWQAPAPDNANKPGTLQGKATNAMNAYCISTLGNWTTCGKCHTGRGAQPVMTTTPTTAQLDNIDCLVCHNEAYALARVRRADGSMGPALNATQATLDGYVRGITKPTRTICLKCHAFAGGGDGVKRGDISAVQSNTADANLDVHMATTRGNLKCQACHKFVNHKVTGKGSDLEATDYASEIKCATSSCHPAMQTGGHDSIINRHLAHVACQTCHIPTYGKVATEVSRDWRTSVVNGAGWKPTETKASNLTPTYKWWNRKTANYLKGDAAVYDAATGTYHMEVLQGGVAGDTTNKIYPFKYKVAYQPMRTAGNILVALDTNQYLSVNGDYVTSVQKGLFNMGFTTADAYTTVKTDTYQMLNHTIADAESTNGVLACSSCHGSTTRIDLKGQLGYGLKGPQSTVCTQCHENETWKGYADGHNKHVTDKKYDCSWCHNFSRPERGLTKP